jgi:drug/metabolite transporter (DMT)-like permease
MFPDPTHAVRRIWRDDATMQTASRRDIARGLLLMILSSSCFGIMGAAAKQANTVMSFWETTFWRGLITTAIVTVLILWGRRHERHDATVGRHWLWLRGLFGTLGVLCYFFAISRIPLAQAVMLNCTSPVFTTLLAAMFLNERLHPQRLIGLVVALAGAYLVVQPEAGSWNWGTLLGLMSGVFSSFAYVIVRRLSATQDPWIVVWHLAVMGIFLGAPGTVTDFHAPVGWLLPCILVMGVAGTLAQGAMTTAFRWLPAGAGSTAGLMTVCVGTLIGWLYFGEVPTTAALMGGALIIAGGIGANLPAKPPQEPLRTAEAS